MLDGYENESKKWLKCIQVVNEYDEADLKRVLNYGELKNAAVLARTIVEAREVQPIKLPMNWRKFWQNIYQKE
jgi:16S rRNA C1402 N4-methylase RsmH